MVKQSDWDLIWMLKRTQSITKTAERLYMTQPGVTKRLRQLEEEFGFSIVVRTAKGVVFTTSGEHVAEYARNAVLQYNAFRDSIRNDMQELRGRLDIAACGSLAHFFLPKLLGEFQNQNAAIEYTISSGYSYRVSQMVNTRASQIGFLRGEHVDGCERVLLGVNQAYAVSAKPFTLEELPRLPRIEFYKDPFVSSHIDAWWYHHYTVPPKIAVTVSSGSTCLEMVKNGLGYAIYLSNDFIRNEDIYKIPLYDPDGKPMIRRDWMIYHKDSLQLEYVSAFVEYVKQYALEHAGQLNNVEPVGELTV